MKKFIALIAFHSLLWGNLIVAQVESNQALGDLIQAGNWFEVEKFYQENREHITNEFVLLWYEAETGKRFNRHKEAIQAYADLLEKNLLSMDLLTLMDFFVQSAVDLCAETQEYKKGKEICGKMISLLEDDTTVSDDIRQSLTQDFKGIIKFFEQMEQDAYPALEIVDTDPASDGTIKMITEDGDNSIRFMANWNGIPLRTIFDTGASGGYIWNREVAKKIGVRFLSQDTVYLNGNIKALPAIIDSLELGKFKIKNTHVYVNMEEIDIKDPKQAWCDSIMDSQLDIVLGMPIIRELGVIGIDFMEKTISFPGKKKNDKTYSRRNIFLENVIVYLMMKVADENFITFFDTGSGGGLSINANFYNKHNEKIKLNEDKGSKDIMDVVGGCNEDSFSNREIYFCDQIAIGINDITLQLEDNCLVAKDQANDNPHGHVDGGMLGIYFFKYLKKISFDFNDMIFSVEPK